MEDESSSQTREHVDKENYPGASTSKRNFITVTSTSLHGEDGVGKRPYRQTSSVSASSGMKKPVQKQKSFGRNIKCILVGDSKVGKSALVRSFLQGQNKNNPDYVPTTQDIHIYTSTQSDQDNEPGRNSLNLKMKEVTLQICDTGGQLEMDRLRPLCYSNAQMVIICFSVMNPASFANVTLKWLPEVKRHCMVTEDPENPLKLLLVGTQSDLRSNVNMLLKLMDDGLTPVSEMQALRMASKIGALKYVESSTINNSNVNHIFDFVLAHAQGKFVPKHLPGLDAENGFHGKILPNLTERKIMFWRKWRLRQNKPSKMKRLVLLPCLF